MHGPGLLRVWRTWRCGLEHPSFPASSLEAAAPLEVSAARVCSIIHETFEINERGETGHQVDAIVTVPVHVGHEKVAVALLHARVKTPDPGAVSLKYGVSGTP